MKILRYTNKAGIRNLSKYINTVKYEWFKRISDL
jgi:hypothetical protein